MVYYKSDSEQVQLIPTNIRDLIPENHICYFVEKIIKDVDTTEFDLKVAGPGNPSYHPKIYLKIIIQGVLDKITSSRKLEQLTHENIIFRYLSEGLHPNFHSISMFRKNNPKLIRDCFLATVEVAKKMNLVNLNVLYLDGTKIKANSSKKQNFTKDEVDFLSRYVDDELKKMNEEDERENTIFGDSDGQLKIPENLTHKKKLEEAINKAKKDLNKSKVFLNDLKEKMKSENLEKINFTDPESKLIKMKKGNYDQAYNCQIMVEDKSEIAVCSYISNNPADFQETIPTIEKFESEQNRKIDGATISQDAGYSNSETAEYYECKNVDAYIPNKIVSRKLHGKKDTLDKFHVENFELDFDKNQVICPEGEILLFQRKQYIKRLGINRWVNTYKGSNCQECKSKKECLKKSKSKNKIVEINPHLRKMRLKFNTEKGMKTYNKRFHKGEIVQAHIFQNLGYRSFVTRGIDSNNIELDLVLIAYNMKKIGLKLLNNLKNSNNKLTYKMKTKMRTYNNKIKYIKKELNLYFEKYLLNLDIFRRFYY